MDLLSYSSQQLALRLPWPWLPSLCFLDDDLSLPCHCARFQLSLRSLLPIRLQYPSLLFSVVRFPPLYCNHGRPLSKRIRRSWEVTRQTCHTRWSYICSYLWIAVDLPCEINPTAFSGFSLQTASCSECLSLIPESPARSPIYNTERYWSCFW